jgi:hypothetical protein
MDLDNQDTHGNPFNLQLSIEGGDIRLNWNLVSHSQLAGYNIYRSDRDVNSLSKLTSVNAQTNTHLDGLVEKGKTYYYRITTFTTDNVESDLSSSPIVYIHHTPKFTINRDSAYSGYSSVRLNIFADKGDSIIISNNSDFSAAFWQKYTDFINVWPLLSGEGTQAVFLKVRYFDGQLSDRTRDTIIVDFNKPTALFSIIPSDSAHISAKFDAAASTDNLCPHSLLNYSWRWQSDTTYSNWALGDTIRHVFPTLGINTITLQVRDQAGWIDSVSHNLLIYNNPPLPAFEPFPAVGNTADTFSVVLSWKSQDPDLDNLHFDIYLDTLSPPAHLLAERQYLNNSRADSLRNNKHYYWKVVSFDFYEAESQSPVWDFYTQW